MLSLLLQEYADALRHFASGEDDAKQAEGAAEELENVKRQLEQQRRERELALKHEQEGKWLTSQVIIRTIRAAPAGLALARPLFCLKNNQSVNQLVDQSISQSVKSS